MSQSTEIVKVNVVVHSYAVSIIEALSLVPEVLYIEGDSASGALEIRFQHRYGHDALIGYVTRLIRFFKTKEDPYYFHIRFDWNKASGKFYATIFTSPGDAKRIAEALREFAETDSQAKKSKPSQQLLNSPGNVL